MESYGPTYIAYTKLWTQHLANRFTVGRLHAELSHHRLGTRAQAARAPQATPRPLLPDACRGASYGASCNPLGKADFVAGTGAATALRQPSLKWTSMLAWNAQGHAARMAYVLDDARVAASDYTERGLMGELLDSLYTTTAISFFAPGYGLGWMAGAVVSGVLLAAGWASGKAFGTAWRGPALFKGADTCGNVLGTIVGVGAGCVAAAGPYAALLAARLPTLPIKALCALTGLTVATGVNRARWLHHHTRAAWQPCPQAA